MFGVSAAKTGWEVHEFNGRRRGGGNNACFPEETSECKAGCGEIVPLNGGAEFLLSLNLGVSAADLPPPH